MSLYRRIFRESWRMTWNRKYLWFFGLFAAILAGGGAEMEILNQSIGGDGQAVFSPISTGWKGLMAGPQIMGNISGLAKSDPFSFFTAMFVLFIISLLVIFITWLAITSQAALVSSIALESSGKDNDVKSGIVAGMDNFWPVLGLNVVNKVAIWVASLVIGLPILLGMLNNSEGLPTFLYILLFVLFVAVALVISLLVKYAICFNVIKGKKCAQSLQDGWRLFLTNWIISAEMIVSLFVLSFLFAVGVIALIMVVSVPFIFVALILSYISSSVIFFWIIASLAVVVIFAIIVVAGSVFSTFQIAAWTNLFIELVGKGGTAKIVRLVEKVMNK